MAACFSSPVSVRRCASLRAELPRRSPLAAALAALLAAGCVSGRAVKVTEGPADPCAPLRARPGGAARRRGAQVAWRARRRGRLEPARRRAPPRWPHPRARSQGDSDRGLRPEPKGTEAGEERGLGVYVQTEAPLYVAPRGAEIGRAFPGAYLRWSRWTPATFRSCCAPSRGLGRRAVKAWLPADAVGTRELSLRAPPPRRGTSRDQRRVLRAEPAVAASAFAQTRCGRLEVLESRPVEGGAEIQAWPRWSRAWS
jgi:hypothetical protein